MTKQKVKRKKRLIDEEKAFVVQELACFGSPKEVSEALMEEYGVQLAPQNIEAYDPGKRAGQHLSLKWRELFEHTRRSFLDHVEKHVPEAHKAVRIRHLARASRVYQARGNYKGMAYLLEQIAKELGNVHTNRREFTGKEGRPIEVSEMSDEQLDARLAAILGLSEDEADTNASNEPPSIAH